MARICVDMDGVIADTYPKFIAAYEREFGRKVDRRELLGIKAYELEGAAHLRDLMHVEGFFRDVAVMADAQEVMKELYAQHEVFIVTTATEFRYAPRDKWDWLHEHFPFIHHTRMVFCGTKDIVRGDYMIDDKKANLDVFNGEGLLFTSLDNHYHTGYRRVNNWLEIREYFEGIRRAEIAGLG